MQRLTRLAGKAGGLLPRPQIASIGGVISLKSTQHFRSLSRSSGRPNTPRHYHHPFHEQGLDDIPIPGKEHPRTVIELRMSALSNAIREKPQWWEKMRNPEITAKWRAEVLEQQIALPEERRLTDGMIEYVLAELEGYASLRDESTGIEPGPYDRIWKSDSLIPTELREELVDAVAPLENVPDEQKDWHPGSDEQVLDLVHPSLYPIVYNRTICKLNSPGSTGVIRPPKEAYYVSRKFQWLPSDFAVSGKGDVTLSSPYINNVHPVLHAKLHAVLPKILQRAIPLFERVLSDLKRPLLPWRIFSKPQPIEFGTERAIAAPCIWPKNIQYPPSPDEDEDEDTWFAKQPKKLPRVKGAYRGDLKRVRKTVPLNGTTIQCITKLANIVLTPEKPEYPGGKWHVEGMMNEHIVASFIYYYDTENITESRLTFRRATTEPIYHHQDDSYCMRTLYEMDRDYRCVQEIGSILISNDRSIAFPNLYQHQVAPFRLEDPTKSGHRKILVMFLVDPTIRIPSATDVAPQQRDFYLDSTRDAGSGLASKQLAAQLVDISANLAEATMTRAEAENYRLELMKERTSVVDNNDLNFFEHEFNMCEH